MTARSALTQKAPLLGAFLLLWLGAAAAAFATQIERTLDGDSLLLADGRQVRLIGINAPEFGRSCPPDSRDAQGRASAAGGRTPRATDTRLPLYMGKDCAPTPDQPLAREARQRLAALTAGQRLRLEIGREPLDRHGRTLAHVFLPDGTSVEDVLLREGLAWMVAIPPNVSRLEQLTSAEAEARRARRGVWAEPAYRPLPAERLGHNTGFQLIEGRVRAVRASGHSFVIELAPQVVILIPRTAWQEHFATHFPGGPQGWRGKTLVARGWLSVREGERRLRVAHPAMLTFAD